MKSPQFVSSAGETPTCQRGWHRKKQPEQVRAALIQCAAELAARQGLTGVTVQAVSDAAGVTKGGFFHHFPHKQALLDAVFDAFMAEREQEIDALIAADPILAAALRGRISPRRLRRCPSAERIFTFPSHCR